MAIHAKKHTFDTVTIISTDQSTQMTFVPARGGVASSLIMQGQEGPRELLYLHDYFWEPVIDDLPGGWPFCFPICARLARDGVEGMYLYEGQQYHLPIHGFAWQTAWQVEAEESDAVTLVLNSSQQTQAHYPFRCQVRLHYQVLHNQLICEQTYTNLDDKAMPYYAGFHPYFLTPPALQGKEKVELSLSSQERLFYNTALTDIAGTLPPLDFPKSVADPALNEQLHKVVIGEAMMLSYPNGDRLQLSVKGVDDPALFPYTQTYTQKDRPFICVEPWMSFPNAMNTVQGVRWLKPGQSERGYLRLALE